MIQLHQQRTKIHVRYAALTDKQPIYCAGGHQFNYFIIKETIISRPSFLGIIVIVFWPISQEYQAE